MPESRKIAAILAADVVGYSRLASADEDRTLARLRALRSDLIDPTIAVHNGRVVKRTGDGSLVEFRSVVDAVRCAIEVLNSLDERNAGLSPERRIEFRVGIHLGDVVEESDGDLMGSGVNIAARLEGIAKPGAICLSEDAYRQVKGRLDLPVSDLGEVRLKNIAEPIRVYVLDIGAGTAQARPATSQGLSTLLALPDKPSIAVLAFQNMSGDPDQEYFADGIVEDIITSLSRFKNLFVIARNSSFTYKGRAVDIKQVGRELGVRYVLEGSVRKAANRVRITGQLVDATTGAHLWADHFDGNLDDIFNLQDQVTASVVGAVAPKVEQAEIDRAKRKPTESLAAYDHYLRGLAAVYQSSSREDISEALLSFHRAIELDPDFASAYGMAALCYVPRKTNAWMGDRLKEIAEATHLAQRAIDLGREDAVALYSAGLAFSLVVGDLDKAAAAIDRALLLNPNLGTAWLVSASTRARRGEPELAMEHAQRALRLSPLDPFCFVIYGAIAAAHFFSGRYEEAISWSEKSVQPWPYYTPGQRFLAASLALAGRTEEARKAIATLQLVVPAARVSDLKDWITLRRPQDAARLQEGLREAGLPE